MYTPYTYRRCLHEYHNTVEWPTERLQRIVDIWDKWPFGLKLFATLILTEVYGLRVKVIRDIIAARKDPNCKAAKKIERIMGKKQKMPWFWFWTFSAITIMFPISQGGLALYFYFYGPEEAPKGFAIAWFLLFGVYCSLWGGFLIWSEYKKWKNT